MRYIITTRPVEAQMTPNDVPIGVMKYSFKAYVQACGFAGDLIITSTTASDLVKSLMLLERLGIEPMTAANRSNSSTDLPGPSAADEAQQASPPYVTASV